MIVSETLLELKGLTMVARGQQQGEGSFCLVVVLVAIVYTLFLFVKEGRCEYKIKEPRNGEKQKGL